MRRKMIYATIAVELRRSDFDLIMYRALNEGGVAGWVDRIMTRGDLLADHAYQQIGRGGVLALHDYKSQKWRNLTATDIIRGYRKYLEEGCHVHIEDGFLIPEDVTIPDADVIVQLALFGEVLY